MKMNRIITTMFLIILAASISLTGCSEEKQDHSGHDDHAEHNHDQDHRDDDHNHGEDDHDHADHSSNHDGHDHVDEHAGSQSLGSIEIGGSSFDVVLTGDLQAGAEVHVDVDRTAGPQPTAVRIWIGDEAGAGVMKAKAPGDGDRFHGHAEFPSRIQDTQLWIEVESEDGTRTAGSLALQGDES